LIELAIITTVWQRPRLTRLVLDYYNSLDIPGVLIRTYAAVSPDEDPTWRDAVPEATIVVESPNAPLTSKWNRVCRRAFEDDPDMLCVVGSDDLLNERYISLFAGMIDYGHDALTSSRCYFFEPKTKLASLLLTARVGAGRFFSRDALVKAEGSLWPEGEHVRADQSQNDRLAELGITLSEIDILLHRVPAGWPIVLDVKDGVNRWGFDDFNPEKNPLCKWVKAPAFLNDLFPEVADDLLNFHD